ncbi:uncharacterized protein KY384_004637 [Bacidia gigantensis]|uniref:uncharacterized protein n=1 Tax=Bacidia gigantensis TaxID=2732470 RepID=UPI001D03E736|nr:uncharacterized protein KY384_004637 [Bacidia gigantensis]KAG8530599.1 hypothetical protein KY384_004637 [Bacidia gigantensis]
MMNSAESVETHDHADSRTSPESQDSEGDSSANGSEVLQSNVVDAGAIENVGQRPPSEGHEAPGVDLEPDMPLENVQESAAASPKSGTEDYKNWFGERGIMRTVYALTFGCCCVTVIYTVPALSIGNARVFPTFNSYMAILTIEVGSSMVLMGILEMTLYLKGIKRVEGSLSAHQPLHPAWQALFWVTEFLFHNPTLVFSLTGVIFILSLTLTVNKPLEEGWGSMVLQWTTGPFPQTSERCDVRVEAVQVPLFTEAIYSTQFGRIESFAEIFRYIAFDMRAALNIQNDPTLCHQGFVGNQDLYGLGIRLGIYLQWVSSLLANNLLPESRKEPQKAFLIFSLAICIATITSTFIASCTFAIEIEIFYWMYWGGVFCVFMSSPSSKRLGSTIAWIRLHWTTAIYSTTHILMLYHGIFYIYYGYDQTFSRMPCGTYHFFLAPMKDPSRSFFVLRDLLTAAIAPFSFPLLFVFPFMGMLLAAEMKRTVKDSLFYQSFFLTPHQSSNNSAETATPTMSVQLSMRSRMVRRLKRLLGKFTKIYREIRVEIGLSPHARDGIYLVTPIDINKRRKLIFEPLLKALLRLRYKDIDAAFARTIIVDETLTTQTSSDIMATITAITYRKITWLVAMICFVAFTRHIGSFNTALRRSTCSGAVNTFQTRALSKLQERRLVVTSKGFMGLVPSCTRLSDTIAVVLGAPIPFVFRPSEGDKEAVQLVGDAYIHGIMGGEAIYFEDFAPREIVIY